MRCLTCWERRVAPLRSRPLPGGVTLYEARRFCARLKGLAGVADMPADAGLHLARTRAIHTFGMRFDLDLVWLDHDGAVVALDRAVPPRRHRACGRAVSVVEVRAGSGDTVATALRRQIAPYAV